GCSRYPQCDFTVPQRPVAQVCSACGGLMVASGPRQARCTGCGQKELLAESRESGVEGREARERVGAGA
ncbi:MAG TPA: hypothetical protein VJO15_09845, partial [Dehalococcoidia bacterium]|nr:hypothetical protein [Dehalococcoidia bacterium]